MAEYLIYPQFISFEGKLWLISHEGEGTGLVEMRYDTSTQKWCHFNSLKAAIQEHCRLEIAFWGLCLQDAFVF